MSKIRRRWLLGCALLFALSPLLAGEPGPRKIKTEQLKGKVMRLDKVLAEQGVRLDRDAAPFWLGLVTADGKMHPLIKDGGSRMFFTDPALLNRPMQLTTAPVEGAPFVRVMSVRSVRNGKLCDVYYWCDICAIRRSEKMICECCGGPMLLREEPVD